MYTQRLPAGGLSADDVPPRRPAGPQSRPAAGRRPGRAAADARSDPRSERGDARPGRRGVLRAHQRLRPRVQDADRGAGGLRPLAARRRRRSTSTASASSRRTTTAAAACWRASWSRRACGSSASSPAAARATCSGTRTTTSRRTTCAWRRRPTSRSPALLKDLKRRGLLDSTLVLWGGEFGRSPEAEAGKGRDHHNLGFTMWMAGGGIKGGQVVGATDAIGLRAVEKPVPLPRHPHDDPAPARPRPAPPDLPAPRPQRAADVRRGQGHP